MTAARPSRTTSRDRPTASRATIARAIREGLPGVGEVQVVILFNKQGPCHQGVGTLAWFERPLLALAAAWAASENASVP